MVAKVDGVDLSTRAVIVNLNISQWVGRKHDKRISAHVAQEYNVASDAGRYTKVLIARDAIKKVTNIAQTARLFHYDNTLPWRKDGGRILPVDNYDTYSEKMREYRAEYEEAVAKFVEAYPSLVQDAKNRMNGMFCENDYPSENAIAGKFRFRVEVEPLPVASDFRANLSDGEVATVQKDIEQRLSDAISETIRDLWERMFKVVSHLSEKLADKDAKFHQSTIANIGDVCRLMPKLNITGDEKLEKMRQRVEKTLAGIDAVSIRKSKKARRKVAEKSKQIVADMAAYMGVQS